LLKLIIFSLFSISQDAVDSLFFPGGDKLLTPDSQVTISPKLPEEQAADQASSTTSIQQESGNVYMEEEHNNEEIIVATTAQHEKEINIDDQVLKHEHEEEESQNTPYCSGNTQLEIKQFNPIISTEQDEIPDPSPPATLLTPKNTTTEISIANLNEDEMITTREETPALILESRSNKDFSVAVESLEVATHQQQEILPRKQDFSVEETAELMQEEEMWIIPRTVV
jgi:hypothetical protein